jgi:hypothetical protein
MWHALGKWLEAHKSDPMTIAIASAVLGALLTKFLPFLFNLFKPLAKWGTKKIGGHLSFRQFEKQYLDWLVITARELRLAGVVFYDDVKKPQLEQVFVSV